MFFFASLLAGGKKIAIASQFSASEKGFWWITVLEDFFAIFFYYCW